MPVIVQNTNPEFETWYLIIHTIVIEILEIVIELWLKEEILDDDDPLGPEDLVLHHFSPCGFVLADYLIGLERWDHRQKKG